VCEMCVAVCECLLQCANVSCSVRMCVAMRLLRVLSKIRHSFNFNFRFTHCNTLQQYTIQHTATHCNTLQHTAPHCNTLQQHTIQHTATHCNTLQHTATHHSNVGVGVYCVLVYSCNDHHAEWQLFVLIAMALQLIHIYIYIYKYVYI